MILEGAMRFAVLCGYLLMGLALGGCQTTGVNVAASSAAAAAPGASAATAIPVNSIREEYDWIAVNRPGWKPGLQALAVDATGSYDIITITKGNQSEEIYFDISAFIGDEAAIFGIL
jgi:hypothetical protein